MNIQNFQILIQLLTLQAKIGLQTKFEANRAKNDILGLWAPSWLLGPSWSPTGPILGTFITKCQKSVFLASIARQIKNTLRKKPPCHKFYLAISGTVLAQSKLWSFILASNLYNYRQMHNSRQNCQAKCPHLPRDSPCIFFKYWPCFFCDKIVA